MPETVFVLRGIFLVAIVLIFVQPLVASDFVRGAMAVLFQFLVLASIALLCGRYILKLLRQLEFRKKELFIFAGFALSLCLAGLLLLHFYFAAEQDIKIYDSITYWSRTIESRKLMEGSIPSYLAALRNSLSTEYGYLIAFPLSGLSYLFGLSFTGYCQSIFVAYYLPSCLLLAVLALRLAVLATKKRAGAVAISVCFACCALCPVLLWPVVLGYADVAGVLLMALLLNYCFDWKVDAFNWKRNLLLALR